MYLRTVTDLDTEIYGVQVLRCEGLAFTPSGKLTHNWSFNRDYGEDGSIAIVAIDPETEIIAGVWRFEVDGDELSSCYTWVHRQYRRDGLAMRMWNLGIRKFRPRRVVVTICTDRGYTFIKSVMDRNPRRQFVLGYTGLRPLRDLRYVKQRAA